MEPSVVSPDKQNYSMPRGRISFAQMADDGTMAGEIDLGNVTLFELTNAATWKEHESSGDAVPVLDCKKPANQQYKVKFTPEEKSTANMALFFLADGESRIQQVGSISGSASKICYLDRWIDLGYWWVESGSIIINGDNLLTFLTTDYSIDYENGLLMIKTGNSKAIADLAALTITFTYADYSVPMFVPRTTPVVGFLRYRGTSEVGPRHSISCWKVQITPDAAMSFIKTQDYSGLSFSGDVYDDDDTGSHSANPSFEIVELSDETVVYPPEPPAETLISWWKGEDNTLDSVGDKDGVWSEDSAYNDGVIGRCFEFGKTGTNRFIITPTINLLSSDNFSIEFYFKTIFMAGAGFIFQAYGPSFYNYFTIFISYNDMTDPHGGRLYINIGTEDPYTSFSFVTSEDYSYILGEWTKLKLVINNGVYSLFIDDVENALILDSGTYIEPSPIATDDYLFEFGPDEAGRNILIDEVKLRKTI